MELTFKCRKIQTTNQTNKLQSILEEELQRKIQEEMELTSDWKAGVVVLKTVVKESLFEKTFKQRYEDILRKTDSFVKIHQENKD